MQSERKYSDGLTALGAGLTVVCLGASLVAPIWAKGIYIVGGISIVGGIVAARFGTKWLREARKQSKWSEQFLCNCYNYDNDVYFA